MNSNKINLATDEKVEVLEFLSFTCAHCFDFERSIPVIKGNFPKRINWKIVPVYWGQGSSKPGEAYLLAEEAGKGEQMKKALFDAHFLENKDTGDIGILEELGAKSGLGFDFSRRLRAGDKSKDINEALTLMKTYGVDETPTLIIAGNLKVAPGMLDHNMDAFRNDVILIIKSILRK
ncbi:MAG: thioredoxin domain-containing protein [Nitrospirae bacterium]|nr:thioredoxin domain-containing protein [Nitrospirota bacterium]